MGERKGVDSKLVVEGDPQVVAPLLGSLLGEVALSSHDRELMAKSAGQRLVLRSKPVVDLGGKSLRDKGKFLRAVEEVEEQFLTQGAYPSLPPSGAAGAMSYRTDGQDFTLSSEHRRYTAAEGLTYGASPVVGQSFELVGFLRGQEAGWGPWRKTSMEFFGVEGVTDSEALEFLAENVSDSKSAARLFFPVDRATCGYLFRKKNGTSVYRSGELTYDAALGTFSVKLFRANPASSPVLRADRLEAEVKARDGAVVMVGDQGLLGDLGLAEASPQGRDGVVVLSSTAVMPCSVGSALDGLRFSALAKHQESLASGPYLASEGEKSQAVVAGRVKLLDGLGQLHQLHLRAGRGADYDWVIGQACPVEAEPRAEKFVESGFSFEESTGTEPLVKAGR